jgi:hypothetical protein
MAGDVVKETRPQEFAWLEKYELLVIKGEVTKPVL